MPSTEENSRAGKVKSLRGRLRILFRAKDLNSSSHVLQELLAEFTGCAVLVMFVSGCSVSLDSDNVRAVSDVAVGYGLATATATWCFSHVSGAHVNPAVSIAMFCTRKMSFLKTFLYCVVQCMGATAGAGVLVGLTPELKRGTLGSTTISSQISVSQGFGVEFLSTFVFTLALFASYDRHRADLGSSTPLTMGLVVVMNVVWAYTGAGMNPARSLGPAIIMDSWEHHWVFWLGPIFGAVVAGVLYDNLFATNASMKKTMACITSADYSDDNISNVEMTINRRRTDVSLNRTIANGRINRTEDQTS